MLIDRRKVLAGALAGAVTARLHAPALAQGKPRVVVVGGGVGGATAAKYLVKDAKGALDVTLVEPNRAYFTPFTSNYVLAGLKDIGGLMHTYDALRDRHGVRVVHQSVAGIDRTARRLRLADGTDLPYDRLVLSPGIDFRWDGVPGHSQAGARAMPHAWGGREQFEILSAGLDAVPDGGLVVIIAPPDPSRCPPAPYERACMMAHRLRSTGRGKARIVILDPKDSFSMQPLFADAWERHYPGMVEWQDPKMHGGVKEVVAAEGLVRTDLETHRAALVNVIPPQIAGGLAREAGLADASGFCPVSPTDMRSTFDAAIHVIGDACIAGDLPKSGFAANNQAKISAMQIAAELTGSRAFPVRFTNNCWSKLSPDDAVKNGGRYEPREGRITRIDGFVSARDESPELREKQAREASGWYAGMTADIFG
jgi:NADPH-dependent 2,4-dienoyl-CoA reductase/sulfur reductase-like enzyme